jgi:hypothetical protein
MRPHTPFVIGYHGCDRGLALQLVTGEKKIKANNRKYHWLGSGVYFWENDKNRAFEWAEEKASRDEIKTPCVIGAVIELGRCLDLSVRENVPLVAAAYASLKALMETSESEMPVNTKAPRDARDDKVLRYLDCAVINHLVDQSEVVFDTVRGLFVEGGRIYEDGEIYHKTHAEIAVRDASRIRGLFLPL